MSGIAIHSRLEAHMRRSMTLLAGFGYYANGNYRNSVYATGRNSGSRVWTAMLNDAGLLYKACVDTQIGGSPVWQCTNPY